MKEKRFLSLMRQAIQDYEMINDGDKLAIGISGGKDSLTTAYFLKQLQRFYPKKFELEAITVDLGFKESNFETLKKFFKKLDINYTVIKTDIKKIVFDVRNENNPCALCAKLRKGAFNKKAKKLDCNKIVFGHHKDDMVETFMMSLIFEGRFKTFSPVTYLDRTKLTLIRPMVYIEENDIINFSNKNNLPVLSSPCPEDGETKREEIKDFIKNMNNTYDKFDQKVFSAIKKENLNDW